MTTSNRTTSLGTSARGFLALGAGIAAREDDGEDRRGRKALLVGASLPAGCSEGRAVHSNSLIHSGPGALRCPSGNEASLGHFG